MRALNPLRLFTRASFLLGCFTGLSGAHAQASETVEVCAQAYSAGQEERLRGNRSEALERFAVCAAPGCPDVIESDCSKWLREVQAEFASVRFVARGHGGERLSAVDVFLDDEVVTLGSDGAALVPPGNHEFRFEAPEHHPLRVERSLGVAERDVTISVVLVPTSKPSAEQTPAAQSATKRPPRDEQRGGGGVPVASIVFGSLGVLSLGVATGFGLSAQSEYDELERECAPGCSTERASGVSSKALVADIALVSGAVALGAAFWIYFSRDDSGSVAFGLAPGPAGAQGRIRAAF